MIDDCKQWSKLIWELNFEVVESDLVTHPSRLTKETPKVNIKWIWPGEALGGVCSSQKSDRNGVDVNTDLSGDTPLEASIGVHTDRERQVKDRGQTRMSAWTLPTGASWCRTKMVVRENPILKAGIPTSIQTGLVITHGVHVIAPTVSLTLRAKSKLHYMSRVQYHDYKRTFDPAQQVAGSENDVIFTGRAFEDKTVQGFMRQVIKVPAGMTVVVGQFL